MNSITKEPTELWKAGIAVIPGPQRCTLRKGGFTIGDETTIALSGKTDDDDAFAASCLVKALQEDLGVEAAVEKASSAATNAIRLVRGGGGKLGQEGYVLDITAKAVTVRAPGSAGLYYGVQTLLQIIRSRDGERALPALHMEDWPDYKYRAAHYDTKHHQDTYDYVVGFIRKLASYKINVLIWEWEDKLRYKRRPEIGAPGAFTIREMQKLTEIARRHHVQLVPLVQGLGHVSFILKHRKHHHLREIPASNWEFCPQKDETYEVMFDLWDDAMDATPGVEFLHVGCDECYELGLGEKCGCKKLADEHGKEYLMQMFLHRAHEHVAKRGRQVISWGGGYMPGNPNTPPKGQVTFLGWGRGNTGVVVESTRKGYPKWLFCPNPGIEPLFLPLFPFRKNATDRDGSLSDTAVSLNRAAALKVIDGMVTCSWDDSGLHNEMWNMRHICGAAYAWSANAPSLDEFTAKFFVSYFGPEAQDLEELFRSMEDRALFFYRTLQRQIWHHGDVGKIHLPDLPRWDLEYDPFWRNRYKDETEQARRELQALDRCAHIIHKNLRKPLRNRDNLEIILTCVDLCRHNASFFIRMADLEYNIAMASTVHWSDRPKSLTHLKKAEEIVSGHIAERKHVFRTLVKVWDRTRLVKGMSTKRRKYLHARDRARHWANRTPGMRYLVLDEERLDMEGYLRSLRRVIRDYEASLRKG